MATYARSVAADGMPTPRRTSVASPEDTFLAWILWLPEGADIAASARVEIARIDGAGNASASTLRLRALFEQAAGPLAMPC